jgi:hypothetical protein
MIVEKIGKMPRIPGIGANDLLQVVGKLGGGGEEEMDKKDSEKKRRQGTW